jgi:hypothetical protein
VPSPTPRGATAPKTAAATRKTAKAASEPAATRATPITRAPDHDRRNTAMPPPTLAAWTMVCNQVLNLDETLNK